MKRTSAFSRPTDLDLVARHIATWRILDEGLRVVSNTDPDCSQAPRLEIAGCVEGNLVLIGRQVSDDLSAEIRAVAVDEPPLYAPGSVPIHDAEYISLLEREAPVERSWAESMEYWFPEAFDYRPDVRVVRSGTAEGDEFLAALPGQDPHGVWAHPIEGHIDAPWCISLHEGAPASICETVRIAGPGADSGVTTATGLRSRGFGAAAVAGWASHPDLAGRTLFYSTETSNPASQRLTKRLGLHYLGATYRIP